MWQFIPEVVNNSLENELDRCDLNHLIYDTSLQVAKPIIKDFNFQLNSLEARILEYEQDTLKALLEASDLIDKCTICLEPFTATGEHRLVSLKCGHLYGKICINTWLSLQESGRRCPECQQLANLNDISVLYAKSIVTIDTGELDITRDELDEEIKTNSNYEKTIDQLNLNLSLKESETTNIQKDLDELKEILGLNESDLIEMREELNSKDNNIIELCKELNLKENDSNELKTRVVRYELLLNLIDKSQDNTNASYYDPDLLGYVFFILLFLFVCFILSFFKPCLIIFKDTIYLYLLMN